MTAPTMQKAATALALGLGLSCGLPADAATVRDRIVAVVNSEVITLSELDEEVSEVKRQARARFNETELDQRLRQIDYMGLNRMIERKLQLQMAKKRGIKVTDEEVKDAVERLRRVGESPNENDPKEMALIKDQLTTMRLVNQQVRSGLLVTEDEVQRFYQQHKNRFVLPQEVRISQILIGLGPSSELVAVREKAQQVFALFKKGERFEELAARYSDGPEGRRGGNLGYIKPGDMLPQIQKAIERLDLGAVTEPIASPIGMHIIRVDERKPPEGRPDEEVKEDLKNLVLQLKSEEAYIEWIKDQKDTTTSRSGGNYLRGWDSRSRIAFHTSSVPSPVVAEQPITETRKRASKSRTACARWPYGSLSVLVATATNPRPCSCTHRARPISSSSPRLMSVSRTTPQSARRSRR